jgi:hypothetical protein
MLTAENHGMCLCICQAQTAAVMARREVQPAAAWLVLTAGTGCFVVCCLFVIATGSDSDGDDWDGGIGIWSIAWSPQGGQLIAGTNGNAVYIYDIESKCCLTKLTNHQDDVNAVVSAMAAGLSRTGLNHCAHLQNLLRVLCVGLDFKACRVA